jgi:hypothetical protein
MSAQPFEISKNGVNQSYLRFLSDSAPGILAIVLFAVAYNSHYSFFGIDIIRLVDNFGKLSTYQLVVITLLALPLGGLLNLGGWLMFGGVLGWLESKRLNANTVTHRIFDIEMISKLYGIDSSSWYQSCELIENVMEQRYANVTAIYEHVKGYDRLLLSMTLLTFISLFNTIFNHCCHFEGITLHILGYLIILVFLIFINAANTFHYSAAILHHSYLICKSIDFNLESTLDHLSQPEKLNAVKKLLLCDVATRLK